MGGDKLRFTIESFPSVAIFSAVIMKRNIEALVSSSFLWLAVLTFEELVSLVMQS